MRLLGAFILTEIRTSVRQQRVYAMITLLVLVLAVLTVVSLLLVPEANAASAILGQPATGGGANTLAANRALVIFGVVGLCVILTAAVVAPALGASTMAAERQRGTLDLLVLELPNTTIVVAGKLISTLLQTLFLLIVSVPFFAPAFAFGGIQSDQIIALITTLCTVTLMFAALGVMFGALFDTALKAWSFAYLAAMFIVFGTLGFPLAFAILGGNDAFRPLLWLNPLLGLVSIGGAATESMVRSLPAVFRTTLVLPPVGWAPGLLLPVWVVASVAWTCLAVALVGVASVSIEPAHAWKAATARRVR